MKNWFDGFKIAWSMLSAVPLFSAFHFDRNAGRSVVFYPFVGLILGAFVWGLSFPLQVLFQPFAASTVLFAIYTLLYGALHTDGFIDTVDALVSYKSPQEMIKIMKDPHVGAQGAVYLFLFLAVKLALFTTIDPLLFIIVPLLSRYSAVIAMFRFPYLSSGSMARVQNQLFTKKYFLMATLSLFLALFFFPIYHSLLLIGIAIVSPVIFGSFLNRKLHGLNGDSYGFLIEISELLLLLTISCIYQ